MLEGADSNHDIAGCTKVRRGSCASVAEHRDCAVCGSGVGSLWNLVVLEWQQHPERYKVYGFDRFQRDWGSGSKYGQIRSYKFALSRSWGNGVIIGVDINGGETPVFLWVDRKTKKIDFSPAELYRPIWDKQLP
jgi:hypothetical protein